MSVKPRAKKKSPKISCTECKKTIEAVDQALFVEEEVGRFFCAEPCIVAHFTPEIEKLERAYGKQVGAHDLSSSERERYAHLRWTTLEKPEELWREKTSKGDHRFCLVSEYKPDQKSVWAVAICLMLKNEPSFLYLAFVTSDRHLVDAFRRGEQLTTVQDIGEGKISEVPEIEKADSLEDRLAEPWTESDSVRAMLIKGRKTSDIPSEDYGFYQKCLEETLQVPNELWSYLPKSAKRIYHFIKHYAHDDPYWYVVIAKDTTDETQIEIVDVFPTRDEKLIELCRYGRKEVLGSAIDSDNKSVLDDSVRRNVH